MFHEASPSDRVELAKSGRSACKLCNKNIQKGTIRVALHSLRPNRRYYDCYYYHKECMKSKDGAKLLKSSKFWSNSSSSNCKRNLTSSFEQIELESAQVQNEKRKTNRLIKERSDLRETLRRIRVAISCTHSIPPYCVFHDSTLDALVEHLPCSSEELMKISGFGAKKTKQYGPLFLPKIKEYKMRNNDMSMQSPVAARKSPENLVDYSKYLREDIRRLRTRISDDYNVQPYVVFHNTTLDDLVEKMPRTLTELRKVRGFGPQKTAEYGPLILPVIERYLRRFMTGHSTQLSQSFTSPSSVTNFSTMTTFRPSSNDDEVVFEAEESLDAKLQRKLQEAKQNGEVVELL